MPKIEIGSRWRCPYCETHTLISKENMKRSVVTLNQMSKHGPRGLAVVSVSCANADCGELYLSLDYGSYEQRYSTATGTVFVMETRNVESSHDILPSDVTVPVPSSVPSEIAITYREAARIAPISGRASAAMSRRCLQGMVRHFFDIPMGKRGNLGAELSYAKDRIDPSLWDNLQAVRSIGDIGAHMDNNVDVIIDISPDEAQILLTLIETLFKDWYETRETREKSSSALEEMVRAKRALQKDAKTAAKAILDNKAGVADQ